MKNKTVLASFLLLAATSMSYSADLAPSIVKYQDEYSETNKWGGWYLGLQSGWAWGTATDTSASPATDLDGFSVGGHAGHNFAIENVILGLEMDANYHDADVKNSSNAQVKSKWNVGLSARIGYAFDSILPYVRIGSGLQDGYIRSLTTNASDDMTFKYFEFGGGFEVEVTDNVSMRIEAVHRLTDEQDYTLKNTYKTESSTTVVRSGLSYHF